MLATLNTSARIRYKKYINILSLEVAVYMSLTQYYHAVTSRKLPIYLLLMADTDGSFKV